MRLGLGRRVRGGRSLVQQAIDAIRRNNGVLYWPADNQLGNGAPNLLSSPEFAAGLTDAPVRGGLVTLSSLTGYDNAISFGHDGVTGNFAYKPLTTTNGLTYTLSVIVEMTDGLAPTFGTAIGADAASSFALVFNSSASDPTTYTVTALGGALYRVSHTGVSTGTAGANWGVAKFAGNNNRTFKVTGYKLELGSLTAYTPQAVLRSRGAFTDSTGLSPVSVVGDVLGLIGDRTQPTIARRNLLTWTQDFTNAVWVNTVAGGGSAPVRVANDAIAPDGTLTADRITFSAPTSADWSTITQNATCVTGTPYTSTHYIKAATPGDVGKIILVRTVGGGAYTPITLTDSYQRVPLTANAGSTLVDGLTLGLRPAAGGSTGTVAVHVWGAQLETGSTATAYQRIDAGQGEWLSGNYSSNTAAWQATTASKPLIQRVSNRYVMSFDGSNDSLQTGLTTGNEGWVCAGVTTTSDATQALMLGGANTSTQNGAYLRLAFAGAGLDPGLQLLLSDGVTRDVNTVYLVPRNIPAVVSGGWNTTSTVSGVNNNETTAARTVGASTGAVAATIGQSFAGVMTAEVYCAKLPNAADRALIRRWIGSLQGQTL